jgi:hypothetical protein
VALGQLLYSIGLYNNIEDGVELITSSYDDIVFDDEETCTQYINENLTHFQNNETYIITINTLKLYNEDSKTIVLGDD